MAMNRIQQISQDLKTEHLKLAMGLDPRIDMHPDQVRGMWSALTYEQHQARLNQVEGPDTRRAA